MKKSTIITTVMATIATVSTATAMITTSAKNNVVETQAKQEFATSQSSYNYSVEAKKQQEQEVKTQQAIEAKYENDNAEEVTTQGTSPLEKQGYEWSTKQAGKHAQTVAQILASEQGFTNFMIYSAKAITGETATASLYYKSTPTETVINNPEAGGYLVSGVWFNTSTDTAIIVVDQ